MIEYDDRSSAEEVVRAIERLANQDQVDFILPPWGTGFNLAVGAALRPLRLSAARGLGGHRQGARVRAALEEELLAARRRPRLYRRSRDLLAKAAEEGQINKQVAMISVADGFGIDLVTAARPSFADAGLEVVYDVTYPAGTTDFTAMLNEAAASGADTFVAFSYPPETFALTEQAQVAKFNPKVLYLGVGTGFPMYGEKNGANAEGIMSLGGIDPKNEANAAYRQRHQEVTGRRPISGARSSPTSACRCCRRRSSGRASTATRYPRSSRPAGSRPCSAR